MLMSEKLRNQAKFPFTEVILATSLKSGKTKLETRERRYPQSSGEFEEQNTVSSWWQEEARLAYLTALKAWGISRSNYVEEEAGGYAEFLFSNELDVERTQANFRKKIINAKKAKITTLEIVRKVKNEIQILKNRHVPEGGIAQMYNRVLVDLLQEVYPKLGKRQKAELSAFLQYQKVLPDII